MTPRDALSLQPNTDVHLAWSLLHGGLRLVGVASPTQDGTIRIVWKHDPAIDSHVRMSDRIMLAAVAITDPTNEPAG